mmetsp:Transcript_91220/g.175632  ORF Transcript_91220/g.175632 Transcript_91220/m.175632 type:complete len:492 (+) Transcript_91220:52-1527(+)
MVGSDGAAEEPTEEDLAELHAFLAGQSVSGLPDLPLPPGFEDGPKDESSWGTTTGSNTVHATASRNGQHGQGLWGESKAIVSVTHEDPSATHLAAKSWDEMTLPKEVLDGIFEMGFVKPSKIQEWALPLALKGGNIVGQAQNGSGKTAAFALAILLKCDVETQGLQGLCVCPTRELALQNHDVISRLGKFTGLTLFLAVPQEERLPRKINANIIVGTPGKTMDLLKRRVADGRWTKIFVLDEADVLIDEDNQMGPQVTQIRNLLPDDLQVLLFSATWPDRVEYFARKMVPCAHTIKVEKEDLTLSTIKQTYIDVGDGEHKKIRQLCDLYGALNVGQSIIFVNTRQMAFDLAKTMKGEGHAVTLICGTQKTGPEQIDIAYRDRIMNQFRNGVTKVLIATDVLSRGIDVPAVTLVVNYEMPTSWTQGRGEPDFEVYMHRIGRTGRFGLRGVAVNLISTHERQLMESIKNYYKCSITELSGDAEEMEALIKNLR